MDRDGTRDGFDLELTRAVADRVPGAGGRVGRRRHARPPGRGREEGGPTPCWPRRSSTSGSSRSAEAKAHLPVGRCRGAPGRER